MNPRYRRAQIYKNLDLVGVRCGQLTVIAKTDQRRRGSLLWECRCACGNTAYRTTSDIVMVRVLSCGCQRGWRDPEEHRRMVDEMRRKVDLDREVESDDAIVDVGSDRRDALTLRYPTIALVDPGSVAKTKSEKIAITAEDIEWINENRKRYNDRMLRLRESERAGAKR